MTPATSLATHATPGASPSLVSGLSGGPELPEPPSNTRAPVVRVRGLGKRFRIYASPGDRLWEWLRLSSLLRRPHATDFWAVKDVTFDLHPGECLGIVGANGSGKSTLLKMLTGALHPTTGSFEVRGRVLSLIELGTGMNPLLTGRQNVINSATLLGFPPDAVRNAMPEIESFAELGDFFDRQVNVYSSGMRVRLAFSMFACFQPDLFIVDEALSVGDVFFQQKCVSRLRTMLDAGMTMLFVSHDQGAVLNLCDRAILMQEGRVAFEGPPDVTVSRYVSSLRGGSRMGGLPPRAPRQEHNATSQTATQAIAKADPRAVAETLERSIIGEQARSRHGTGRLIVRALRVTDEAGRDTLVATVGSTIRVHFLLQANQRVERPRCGLRLYDRFNTMVFSAGTFNLGVELPAMDPGDHLLVEFRLTLDVAHEQYTLGAGCGEPDPIDESAGVHHDRLERLGPITVTLDPAQRRGFYGLARLPMTATCLGIAAADRNHPE